MATRTPVNSNHICVDERGVAWIAGTQIKVIEVALDLVAYAWSAEAIHIQHPHLSLAQIHAALSYYYDHQAEFDAEIQRQAEEYDRLLAARGESPTLKKARALGLGP
jgi:uncharacterized protein (DUF433 family)